MSNFLTKEKAIQIMQGISKKTPQGIMLGNTTVGHITWQMYLMRDYLKLDGTPLANASNDYSDLLKFAQDNNLITADTTDKSLFKYDSSTDVLTLPDYIGLVVQGGNTVEEKEAGLPNIYWDSQNNLLCGNVMLSSDLLATSPFILAQNSVKQSHTTGDTNTDILGFDASRANPIYGNSTTVQPPAIQLIPQIKYRTSTSIWDTVEIGKFVATAPAHYEREQLYTTNKTTITIYPTWVNINGMGYVLEGTKTIDIENADNWDDSQYVTASNRAGKDFYIYVTQPIASDEPIFVLSANSTVPNGYTADNSRKIGGFHCLCVDVGTISGHTLSGYLAGEILPNSPWDLKHRAVSENEGMVWIPEVGKWVDIYLASWDGSKLVSQYNAVIVDGASSPNFHGEKFAETFGLVNKQLPRRDDFVVFAKGSNEGTNIYGSSDPNTTGGHVDTNNRRMISNYGLEDCCGVLWQWARDCTEFYPGATWSPTTNQFLVGYSWQESSVYNASTDAQKYGSCNGLLRRFVLGGCWDNSSNCGSRSMYCNCFSAVGMEAMIAARGASEPRTIN